MLWFRLIGRQYSRMVRRYPVSHRAEGCEPFCKNCARWASGNPGTTAERPAISARLHMEDLQISRAIRSGMPLSAQGAHPPYSFFLAQASAWVRRFFQYAAGWIPGHVQRIVKLFLQVIRNQTAQRFIVLGGISSTSRQRVDPRVVLPHQQPEKQWSARGE
jgi:hypothetical protein